MKIFRHWHMARLSDDGREVDGSRSNEGLAGALGWSNESPAAAHDHALQRARRFFETICGERDDLLHSRYSYDDRPVREPILDEIDHAGERVAAITRNGYGATVLNAASLFIADVDLDRGAPTMIGRLFGKQSPERQALERITATLAGRPSRVYRTAAGLRIFVVDRPIDPASDEALALLEALGSDPLYRRLCEHQQCYRARLTPKPWRLELPDPPKVLRNPSIDARKDADAQQGVDRYERASADHAVCERVDVPSVAGSDDVFDEAATVMRRHDSAVLQSGKPLA